MKIAVHILSGLRRGAIGLAAAAGLATGAAQAQDVPPPKLHDLGDGLYVYEFLYSNSPFLITEDGVLVMDTYNDFYAAKLKEQIAELTDQPVRYVVYSHAHTDHVRGARAFGETATYIAQERAVEQLEYVKEDSFPMPDVTFDEQMALKLGKFDVILRDFGDNHATGVTVMHIPQKRLITTLDIAYKQRMGYYHLPDFNPRAWRDSLHQIAAEIDFDTAISGHGTPVLSRADFDEFSAFLDDLIGQVQTVWNDIGHMGPFQGVEIAKERVDLSAYKDWVFYDEFRDLNIMAVYHSIDMGY